MFLLIQFFKIKVEIPSLFLKNRKREEYSSLFGFNSFLTLVSYVPKRSKAVILLSTRHHDGKLNLSKKNKPEIILAYNKYKGIKTNIFVIN